MRFIAFYRMTRPLRDAHKAFKRAGEQYRRQTQSQKAQPRQRRSEGKSFIREYAEDVEYIEVTETNGSKDGAGSSTQQTIVESQVTDVEWEEVGK